ncbi:MAG: NifU family protein [Cyclobacteriaceae bacterium]|jgi:Fe-S cluster biogenesis protein NfuA|nr:hypothetical protein [Cytophagales bacterium]HNP78901.1 NifU family protein [Cyclobacteriaceae bacterium]HQQ83640.1 NifU family protein [Cyclobacteriaceae bacterium]
MSSATLHQSTTLIQRVESALDGIRPYLEADGGNIRILEITEELVVRLEFVGNCVNCPMSTMTFRAGVEEAIRKSVPEVRSIEVVNLATVS